MKLHEMKQKRNTIAADMRALHDKIGDNTWTDEQRADWGKAKDELKKLDEAIAREDELRALDQTFVQTNEGEQRNALDKNKPGAKLEEQRVAVFDGFLRRGLGELSAEERTILKEMRAQGTSPDEKGGYTVPTQMMNTMIESMKAFGGIAQYCADPLHIKRAGNRLAYFRRYRGRRRTDRRKHCGNGTRCRVWFCVCRCQKAVVQNYPCV